MTREEAFEQMKNGAKVRHGFFTSEEYLFMDGYGNIMTEDGYEFADQFFKQDWFATGWKLHLKVVVVLGSLDVIKLPECFYEPRIEREVSQSQIQNWLQNRQLAQKSALRLHAHEGVYSRWNQSKCGGRPFRQKMQGRARIHRKR